MADQRDIIIIRRAADNPRMSAEDRAFLLNIAALVESGGQPSLLDRWMAGRLIRRAALG